MFSHEPAIAVDVIMAFMTFCIRNGACEKNSVKDENQGLL